MTDQAEGGEGRRARVIGFLFLGLWVASVVAFFATGEGSIAMPLLFVATGPHA